jgi:hypothetical protein
MRAYNSAVLLLEEVTVIPPGNYVGVYPGYAQPGAAQRQGAPPGSLAISLAHLCFDQVRPYKPLILVVEAFAR